MNKQTLRHYIKEYKQNFQTVNQKEIYKWKAVKCFQDNWDIDADNFYKMLLESIRLTQNLLQSGQYFPLRMLMHYSENRPNVIRSLFKNIYNEEDDLFKRIENFQKGIENLNNELFPGKNTYQDHRAIIVYLALRFPERYYFYKFEIFRQFSEKLGFLYKPVRGTIENIGHFNNQCELIRYELSIDQDLLKLHKNRITSDCFYDENLNILTQDFIYAVVKHLDHAVDFPEQNEFVPIETRIFSTELINLPDELNFRGRTVNFIQNEIENKRLGDLGELWVMKYEIEKLKKANKHNLISQIKHTSKDSGDGTGFDIQSFDREGNKIFIEVKTTKGRQNSTFFITRNELERSKIEKHNYYLYRLYNYNEKEHTADLLIINGDLTNICDFPTIYKININ